jgi:Zn-dependent peptidase ImmA (M78 family)/transcriptional regulator with XRE-family HTH domain
MQKNIVTRLDRNLARRLREARRESGLSTRAVAARIPRRLAVSHTTIANYENGVTVPPIDVLGALANLYKRPLNWFLESRETLGGFRYRNLKSRVPLSEQRRFEATAGKWADAYLSLDRFLDSHPLRRARPVEPPDEVSPEKFALAVRRTVLNLDDGQPVQNMIGVLETFSAWALEVKADFSVDGAAARHGDEFVVIINPTVANERIRMNAAHELAYLLYDERGQEMGWGEGEIEKNAYLFATTFLLPPSQLAEAFAGKSFLKLIQYKERFGLSLIAMVYLAEKKRIINTATARWLWSEIAKRGWRQKEPGYVWRERAITFEMMLETAIHSKRLSWSDAERITGVREDDLKQRLAEVVSVAPPQPAEGGPDTIKFMDTGRVKD